MAAIAALGGTQGVIAMVSMGEQLIFQTVPIALDLALKIKALFAHVDGAKFDVVAISNEAIAADEATIQMIDQWKISVGLPVDASAAPATTEVPATPAPATPPTTPTT